MEKQKTLVAYFSCSGYTKKVAKSLSEVVGGELYEITPATPYTSSDLNWNDPNSRSSIEMKDKSSRPAISGKIDDFGSYNVVYIGFPIWWYIAPTLINTFLESYDFSGKRVISFCTSGSSGVGQTDRYLQSSCSKQTKWYPAKRFPTNVDKNTLAAWVDSLNL